ncbi:differentiation-inducing gene 1-like [Podarcis lilfordi]|uniref:Differentiation-inducing gene 1-like n=1 Tax=Podarcis lilfordi TaxID=74358 RepID=A0AA35LG52_9SAUR|nr:differentiation-inducing gene 1-like [Podarcis lilfordi]
MEASQRNVNSYLALSIFNLLCCCLPLGIAALVFSLQARSASNEGNINQAASSSRTARILNIIGIVIGAIMFVIIIVIVAVGSKNKP